MGGYCFLQEAVVSHAPLAPMPLCSEVMYEQSFLFYAPCIHANKCVPCAHAQIVPSKDSLLAEFQEETAGKEEPQVSHGLVIG